tara:strand:- start:80 stop:586 length:507 start_codon:yes stop_codon:yes gene_type:complete
MNKFFNKIIILILTVFFHNINAESLAENAIQRGINETCSSYLSQIESSYDVSGLNITFAHPENPSLFPSLHISSKKYNNGSSNFSATLSPDEEYCYISTILVTSINNQSCIEIANLRLEKEPNLKLMDFADGDHILITPNDNSFQTILTNTGNNSCTMTESQMFWPGR